MYNLITQKLIKIETCGSLQTKEGTLEFLFKYARHYILLILLPEPTITVHTVPRAHHYCSYSSQSPPLLFTLFPEPEITVHTVPRAHHHCLYCYKSPPLLFILFPEPAFTVHSVTVPCFAERSLSTVVPDFMNLDIMLRIAIN